MERHIQATPTLFFFVAIISLCASAEHTNIKKQDSLIDRHLEPGEEREDYFNQNEIIAPVSNPTGDISEENKQIALAQWAHAQKLFRQRIIQDSKIRAGSDVSARQQCQDDLALMFGNAVYFQLWAVKMVDSWGKLDSGLFRYNPQFLGDYDTCLGIETNQTYNTEYCVGRYSLKKLGVAVFPRPLSFQAAICAPTSCTGQDLKALFNIYLAPLPNITLTVTSVSCKANSIPFTEKAKAVIAVCSVFAFFMLVGTLYDVLVVKGLWKKLVGEPIEYDTVEDSFQVSGSLRDAEKLPLLNKPKENTKEVEYKPGPLGRFLLSFSVRTNGEKVMSLTSGPGAITCINGIRFFSMSWVILGHTFSMAQNQMSNLGEYQAYSSQRWTFMAVRNALVSVDSFFVLSGLLMMYLVLKELKKRRPGPGFFAKFYFHRYWRLTPPYMLVLMVYVPLFKYVGDGPFWPQEGLQGSGECEDTWWTNILYINNFVKSDRMCMGWSWYLANDMQFYIISPLIFLPNFFLGRKGLLVPMILLLAHFITTGVLSKEYNLTINGGKDHWQVYYVKPYTRIGPYLVGMLTGYVMYVTECKTKIHKLLVLCGWTLAWAVALACLYGVYDFYKGASVTYDVAALYNSLHRTGWAIALCWLIFACASGYGGVINSILSWPGFAPLSRLTYCAYLVHPLVIHYYFMTLREPFYLDNNNMIFIFLGVLLISYFLAFVTSMAFEAPFLGLEKLLVGGLSNASMAITKCVRGGDSYEGGYDSFYNDKKAKSTDYAVRYSDIKKSTE